MAKAGLPAIRTKTEPRCKICLHPKRIEIEQMMVLQARKERNEETGHLWTIDDIQAYALKHWDFVITDENYRNHIEKHFCIRESVQKAARMVAKQSDKLLQTTVLTEILADLQTDAVLEEIIAFGVKNMRDDEGASITPDLMLKAIQEKNKRREDDEFKDMLALGARAANIGLDVLEQQQGSLIDIEEVEVEEEQG